MPFQSLRIPGWVPSAAPSIAALYPLGSWTAVAGGAVSFLAVGSVADSGWYEGNITGTDTVPLASGWYRGVTDGAVPWFFEITATSGVFEGQSLRPGATTGTVTTYTGNTPQTGDSFTRIGATGSGLTSLASAASLAFVQSDTFDIQTRLPAALVGGRIDSSTGAMAANVITAASTAADVIAEIQAGLATPARSVKANVF